MNGESGEGYLSSNSSTDWPFLPGSVPERVSRLFADAIVFMPSMSSYTGAVIRDLSVSGSELSFSLCVVSDYEETKEVGTVNAFGEERYLVCRVSDGTFNASFVVDGWHLLDSEDISGVKDLEICASCIARSCDKVTSISILNSVDGTSFPSVTKDGIKGDVKLVGGHNVNVSASGSVEKGVVIDAVPGSGTGVVPCECEDPDDDCKNGTERRYGNVESDEDDSVEITCDHCMSVVPFRGIGTVMIYGRCNAPCTVDMYLEEAEGLSSTSRTVKSVKKSLLDTADRYKTDVQLLKRGPCDDIVISGSVNSLPERAPTIDLTGSLIYGSINRLSAKLNIANTGFKSYYIKVYSTSAWYYDDVDGDGSVDEIGLKLVKGVISAPEENFAEGSHRTMMYANLDWDFDGDGNPDVGMGTWPIFLLHPGSAADVTSLFFDLVKRQKRTKMRGRYVASVGFYPEDPLVSASSIEDQPGYCLKRCEVEF